MTPESEEPVLLCCLLWAQPERAAALADYENKVLALLPEHDGTVVQRAIGRGAADHPHEVQLLRFANRSALEAYMADPRAERRA